MAKTYQDFYNQYVGKRIDYDGSYGVQCVDGFKVFCSWAGIPVKTTGTGYADGYWYNRNSSGYSKYFDFVSRSELKNGDWVMWARGSGSHPHSHIAMYYNGKEFGENQGSNREFRLITGHFGDALGGFRWKEWSKAEQQQSQKTEEKKTSQTESAKSGEATSIKTTDKLPEGETEETTTETVQRRTTIESVNSGKDYIENAAGIELFGRIVKTVEWNDVTVPANLKAKAETALASAVNMAFQLEVDAVDASLLDFKKQPFKLGEMILTDSPPHGLGTMVVLSKRQMPLDKPQDAHYTFGTTFTAMTEQQVAQKREAFRVANEIRQINVSVNEVTEEKQTEIDPQDRINISVDWVEVYDKEEGS